MVKQMRKANFNKNDLATWMCIVKYESEFNQNAVHPDKLSKIENIPLDMIRSTFSNFTAGHSEWGLFQISDE